MQTDEEEKNEGVAKEEQINIKSRRKRSESFATTMWLWEDPENIPFMFDSSFEEEYKLIVKKAKTLWEGSTCLKFVEVTAPPENNKSYILLTRDGGSCTTDNLGPKRYSPYKTVVDTSLCSNEAGLGPLVHEFGHVIGLTHSQNRLDRDDYLRIYVDNIMPDWIQQYNKDDPAYFSNWGVPFYY
uniref:Metalloendopeptidase n=1 Tax=Romanomermis culicivorax TaxID=13658 RepID=A0A915L0G1_ROMCU